MAGKRLLLGIDGGQTSTKALLSEVDGTLIATGKGPPSDHFHIAGGIEKNRRAIHESTRDALTRAGAEPSDVVALCLGLTGAPPVGEPRGPVYQVIGELLDPEQITIHPDYVTNLTGASGGGPGVVLIAGGGAIGYGITADGREAIAGGFGYLLGDDGSAFKIGIGAIKAASHDRDKRGNPTLLTQMICDYFEIENIRDITRIVYRAGFERNRISLLAPLVAQAAEAGDAPAEQILIEAGRSLGLIALGVIRQLFESKTVVGVYLTGGVFNIGSHIIDPLTETLVEAWPEASTRTPRFPPTVGSVIVAARSIGLSIDDAFLDRIEATLPDLA